MSVEAVADLASRNFLADLGVTADMHAIFRQGRGSTDPVARNARLAEIIEPDSVLPAQFFSRRSDLATQPERRLMLAVLEDAVLTFVRCVGDKRRRARRLKREVEVWLDPGNGDWPFSFENICATLGIDAGAVRKELQQLQCGGHAHSGLARLTVTRRTAGKRHRVSAARAHRRTAGAKPLLPAPSLPQSV